MKRQPFTRAAAITITLGCLSLAACATDQGPEPKVVVQRVEVPVAVKCAVDPGPEPTYADTPEAIRDAADIFGRVKLLLAGRDQRDARLAELKAASAGCSGAKPYARP